MEKEWRDNPLFGKADVFAKEVYRVTREYPQEERYGITSQIRRAALSVILNIIEGFARQSENEFRRFLYISYGSLKETKYLLEFSKEQGYISTAQYDMVYEYTEETARLLWRTLHPKEYTKKK